MVSPGFPPACYLVWFLLPTVSETLSVPLVTVLPTPGQYISLKYLIKARR